MENIVPSETDLLEGARRYDRQSLARIYDRYSPGIYRYALRLLGDETLAEDCVAETFHRFLHGLKAHRGPRQHLQAYLYRTAHNLIVDRYRNRAIQEQELDERLPSPETDPETSGHLREQQAQLRAAILSLTRAQQMVITLRFIEDMELDEVAAALGKPVGAIKSLQHRALARLQRFLKVEVEE